MNTRNSKIHISDIIGMINDYTKLTIRDVTKYSLGALGSEGDGIIYNGECKNLKEDHPSICSMEVVNISPQHEYCNEVSLYIVARHPKYVYQCSYCNSMFTTSMRNMLTRMCPCCGSEMKLEE